MTTSKIKLLEELIGELSADLGHKQICIVNAMVQDGFHIALYDKKGEPYIRETSYDLESTIKKVIESLDKHAPLPPFKP